eukprot:snap_masked-scaffold_15-processed-gene-3.10-mRNA-1 protein AED:1.00 eAED:1.00 QI:0/-1/0/0/-1/1/1/0/197
MFKIFTKNLKSKLNINFQDTCNRILFTTVTTSGVGFELLTLDFLQRQFMMTLEHVGGPNDNGIDLKGRWSLLKENPVVIVQCKHRVSHKSVGSKLIRELEGTLALISNNKKLIGIVANSTRYSAQAIKTFKKSSKPMLLFNFDLIETPLNQMTLKLKHIERNLALAQEYPELSILSQLYKGKNTKVIIINSNVIYKV